jgi:hypothetical protein
MGIHAGMALRMSFWINKIRNAELMGVTNYWISCRTFCGMLLAWASMALPA